MNLIDNFITSSNDPQLDPDFMAKLDSTVVETFNTNQSKFRWLKIILPSTLLIASLALAVSLNLHQSNQSLTKIDQELAQLDDQLTNDTFLTQAIEFDNL